MKVKLNKKKIAIVLFIIFIVFICSNAFAALVGVPNIFFAIKNMVVQEEVKGEDELLLDRDITISYSPIKIKDGVELQVNRILIEEGKSKLFITLENKNNDDEQLGINVYNLLENNNTNDVLSEDKFLIQKGINKNFEIELNKKVSTDEKLLLEIIIDGKVVNRNIIVDLASKEIIIEGTEEVKKISEVELKEYLGCFSVLNYKDLKMNDRLLYVAQRLNSEVFKNQIEANSQRELMMNIVDSFYNDVYTTETVNGIEILKPNKQQYNYEEESDSYTLATEDAELPKGLCLEIEDISYNSGIYTVEFIYVFPTQMDIDENRVEELEQYKATIELELNEDSEYSKYKVVNLSEETVIEKEENDDSSIEDVEKEDTKEENIEPEDTEIVEPDEEKLIDGVALIDFVREHGTVYYGVSTDKTYEIELIIFEGLAYYNTVNPGKSLICTAGDYVRKDGELVLKPIKHCGTNQTKFEYSETLPSHTFKELSDGSLRLKASDSVFGSVVLSKDKSMATRELESSPDKLDDWSQISGKYIFEKVEKNGEKVDFTEVFGQDIQNKEGYIELTDKGGVKLQVLNKSEVEYGTFIIGKNNTIIMHTDSISDTQEYDTITRTLKLNYNDYTIYARYQ